MATMIKAVILDGDGTSFDTEKAWVQSCVLAGESLHSSITRDQIISTIGAAPAEFRNTVSAGLASTVEFEEFLRLATEFMSSARTENGQFPEKEGFSQLVSEVKRLAKKVALATSADKDWMKFAAGTRLQLFDELVCVDDVSNPKPDPDVYIEACRRLSLKPEECLAVEDSPNGIRAATSAKIRCILVRDITPVPDEILALAEAELPSLKDVIKYLQES